MTRRIRLKNAPVGLFWFENTLALKTEYGSNEGRIDCYIVASGEFFWGPEPQIIEHQRELLVTPVPHWLAFRNLNMEKNA